MEVSVPGRSSMAVTQLRKRDANYISQMRQHLQKFVSFQMFISKKIDSNCINIKYNLINLN